MKENEVVREMTFEEEAVLYEKAAKELFAKETPGEEAPPINHLIRRGMRIIRKARKEKERMHGKWVGLEYDGFADGCPVYDLWECSECGEEVSGEDVPDTHPYCHNCGARMDGE